MKKILALSSLLVSFAAGALVPQIECIKEAQKAKLFSLDKYYAILCSGAQSTAPVDCVKTANRHKLFNGTPRYISNLCSGATSDEPVVCALDARNESIFVNGSQYVVATCGSNGLLHDD